MINKDEIKHIAHLARLGLSAKEVNQYSKELSAVVDYIDQLKEVDTINIEPTAQVTGLVNRSRQDEVKFWNKKEVEHILEQAGSRLGEEIKVKRVLK